MSEWLGELNVSHTGGRYYASGQSEPTASLGLLFDWNYRDKGMRIAEVIDKGPFDNASTKAKAGIIIEKIDGTEITPEMDYYTLLNDKAKKKTLVSLYNPQTKERWEEVVIPISGSALNALLLYPLGETTCGRCGQMVRRTAGSMFISNRWAMTVSVPSIRTFW